jgi:hypothetical protein
MKLRGLPALLLAALVLLFPITSEATLLFTGGENVDFNCNIGGSCNTNTTAGSFRAGWARESYTVVGTPSDPPTNRFATLPFTPTASFWVHAQHCSLSFTSCGAFNGTTNNDQMLRLMDSNGNASLIFRGTGAGGTLKISSRTAAGSFTDLTTCPSALGIALTQLDVFVNYAAAGEIALYANGVEVCDYTGNVTNGDGATALSTVEFSSAYNVGGDTNPDGWSEIIVATTDTRAMARFTANTVANGNTAGFSGTNVCSAIWGNTGFSDASFAFASTSNLLHECTVNNAIPPGSYSVLGLAMTARVLVGATGPQHFDFATRVNGSDYLSPDFAPLNAFSNVGNYIQTVNPATSAPWAVSDFQAAGFNVGEETKP